MSMQLTNPLTIIYIPSYICYKQPGNTLPCCVTVFTSYLSNVSLFSATSTPHPACLKQKTRFSIKLLKGRCTSFCLTRKHCY